ncbi:cell wall-binding repeat-containing protein [Clostridium autoethanogenum]|uniref:Cell wall-binding repeat-containing protein n=1 Tax=Clostridium autoethanogenum DSM 10061 TaxID=1341692 RepID=A0ABM5NYV7_9CLOT|nr:cell wall-binding repeat-containing protein [Clostridium autoethanogenum]AGY77780.1 cell wall-binding repeat-containing protein [Clostridium autoethanogenum DSM 10061]ALU37915.1 Cell wall binding protein [Clostridium autoethanogenum DSM 10061]OVY49734.1 N-acetylmuramoyl-L-alanine amidase LytC precursor [Clostridium autoethanogenum]
MFRRFKKIITKIALLAMIFSIFPQNVVKVHADPAPIDESSAPVVATLSYPQGIAVDSSNNIYVASDSNNYFSKISPDGTILKTYTGFDGPYGVSMDSSENLYVTSDLSNTVTKISKDGTILKTYTGFNSPYGVAVDSDGNLYVVNQNGNTIQKVSKSGELLKTYSDLNLNSPYGIALDSSNNIYVADYGNHAVKKVSSEDGTILKTYDVSGPCGVAIDSDNNIYIAEKDDGCVEKLSQDGIVLAEYTNCGSSLRGIALDKDKNIYVSDEGNGCIKKIIQPAPASTACDIITWTAPASPAMTETTASKTVPNGVTSLGVDVAVSANATWKLYSDAVCSTEITNKTMNLNVGVNTAYIKVTAEDGTTKKIYTVKITRQAPAATEITSFDKINDVLAGNAGSATYSDAAAVIAALPTTVKANNSAVTVPVSTWVDTDHYNPSAAGSYTFTATLGAIPTGYANSGNYTATVKVIVSSAPGGTVTVAGDSKITGLTIGNKYKVTVDGAVKYVKADGTLSDNESDAAALTGTEITGLTNGKTYKVEVYVQNGNTGSSGLSWQLVGNADISEGIMMYPGIAIAPDGTLYILYSDKGNGSKATVMKYDNINKIWTAVGGGVVSAGEADCTTIDIDKDGVPYIGYTDMANGFKGTVMKYDSKSNSWTSVGKPGFTGSHLGYPTITIDKITGTPYIAFKTPSDKGGATVMKYDSTSDSWITVGDEDFTENGINSASIAIYNGVPYFAYADANKTYDDKATVMKYDGKNWVTVGNKDFSKGNAGMLMIAIDGNGVPYVSYEDTANDGKATVMKYDSETKNWVTVGSEGFSAERANSLSMAIDKDGTPYIVYEKIVGTNIKSVVMKYESGSWKTVGDPDISLYVSMAIDKNGVPYILSGDNANGYKATVEAYLPSQAGTVTLAEGSVSGAVAGDSKVTGLTIGSKYKVTVDGAVKYVKADGTLSDNESDAAALTGTEIIGLTNGKTYKVEAYTPPSGNSFSIQVTGKPVETVNSLDVTPNMTGGYHFKLPNATRDALLSDVNSVNTDKVDVTISKGSKSISGEFPKTNITNENLIAGVVLPVTVSSPIIVAGNTITSGNYNISIKMIPGSTESDFDIAFISKPGSHSGGSSGSSSGGTSDQTTVTGNVVEGNSQSQVSNITASVTTDSSGNKTVSMKASEVAALKAPDGTVSGLTDVSKLSITTDKGTPVTIGTDGTVKIESLAKGTTNNFNLTYDLGNGQKIVIGTMEVKVGTDGKVGLQSNLIDPYGIITDVSTGKPIDGANVTVYYANTDRDKAAGKKPDTEVPLPGIDGFKPNNNKNPQVSDSNGAYGFMVFPNSDYYVVVNKDGYYKYVSPTISVEKEIVKWDIRMNKEDASSKVTGVQRLSGQNRIDTALDIAKATYPGKISNVVIASAQNYPDALSGSVLAYKLNAPMLLVGSTDEDQQKVLAYIKSCMDNTGSVYILGGNGAVSKEFEDKVTANGFKNITRLGGADRYETSEKIAEKLNVNKETPVVIVSGEDYADAASISNIAAANQYPILLVRKNEISDTIKKEISTINPTKVFIIGLQGSIDTEVENTIAQIIPIEKSNITRIGGSDRYETSLEVGKYFKLDGNEACIASGNNFPDALAGSIYAGKHNAPIVLVNTKLSDNQTSYLKDRKLSGATIFGGEGVVDKNIQQQLSQIIGK